ncbi:hypothetical protein CROQUDRAFT_652522 [Cronartium quercuum f. sp. fusiforme G11]|uniref:F-box domain-containing protein n=1 Tax=Cronartium quercuum f. sp. fusiforme G11 TaxID=708437 RepID=A0A9P6NNC6_9BASI|nr:hypothetical protein CROQUDRAFT_652522 [Cronartium quercuum f. sp. fusiforme G11]
MTIDRLPPESLTHIFAHLSPHQISISTLVCKTWYRIIQDDSCWKAAFKNFFGIQNQIFDSKLNHWIFDSNRPMSNLYVNSRLDPTSWKNEYRIRIALLSKWKRNRPGKSITHNPGIGIINTFNLISQQHEEEEILLASLDTGIGIKSQPFKGKISLNQRVSSRFNDLINCLVIRSDGKSIAWGMSNGKIELNEIKDDGLMIERKLGRFDESHLSSINCLKFIKVSSKNSHSSIIPISSQNSSTIKIPSHDRQFNILVSCCNAGQLKLWRTDNDNEEEQVCICTITLTDEQGFLDSGTTIAYNSDQGILAVGTHSGLVHLWADINLLTHPKSIGLIRCNNTVVVGKHIERLAIDSFNLNKLSILIQLNLSDTFERYWTSEIFYPTQILKYGSHSLGSITCLEHDLKPHGNGLVVAGDKDGKAYVWAWSSNDFAASAFKPPLICLQSEGPGVSAIAITPLLIAIGSDDGSTRVYDALSGGLMNLFKDKQVTRDRLRMITNIGNENESVRETFKVRSIWISKNSIVLCFGELVMGWKVDRKKDLKQKKNLRRASGRTVPKRTAFTNLRELKEELANTRETMNWERDNREQSEARKRRLEGELGRSMSEEEALQYALMLSREEDAREWEQETSFEALNEEVACSAPFISDPRNHSGSSPSTSYSAPLGRTINEYRNALRESVGDLFEGSSRPSSSRLQLTPSRSSTSSGTDTRSYHKTLPESVSTQHWPSISRGPGTPSPSPSPHMPNPWNKVGIQSPSPSRPIETIDDELQFAIELSLADHAARDR